MTRVVRRLAPVLGLVPFLGFLTIFLLIPTIAVVVGAFVERDQPSLSNIRALFDGVVMRTLWNSVVLSGSSAVIGAVLGALLAYAVVTGRPDGLLRRSVTAACGVLAQFGGVTLAFAFIATLGFSGVITEIGRDTFGVDLFGSGWLFGLKGLTLVYTYFQIPLMVIVFLPALDGIRPQWREAAESLGGTSWQYWRHIAIPLLTAPFMGAVLLLFANAFAAYATAAALISQGGVIIPLQIRIALTSETVAGQENVAKALALGMIIVVAIAMTLYAMLQRRSARWLR